MLLLFVDERTGHVLAGPERVGNALSGTMLIELVHSGRLAYDPNGRQLWVADPTPLPDPFRHESLRRLHAPLLPQRAVERIRLYVRDNVMTGLHGVLGLQRKLFAGFVILNPAPLREVRAAVGGVLFGHQAPDARTGALIAMLHAVGAVQKVFEGNAYELNARAEQVIAGHTPAVHAVHAAVKTRMVAAAVTATREGKLLR